MKAATLLLLALIAHACCAQKRLVLIDQDGSGPGGSNQMAILALLQSPDVRVLGITMVTGNAWCDEEAQHTLRMLELTGHADVPLAKGAVFPLVRDEQETRLEAALAGKVEWLGAWGQATSTMVTTANGVKPEVIDNQQAHGPYDIPPLPEGMPTIKPIDEDAAHFLVRQVHAHPHQVTIYAAGPLTDIALAVALDPHFAELAEGLVVMGGSLDPHTDDPEFSTSPRHEFNFWFDPEAAYIVLRAPWKKITCTPADISIQTRFSPAMVRRIASAGTPLAQYIARYYQQGGGNEYMWDELAAAAWLDPSVITKQETRYLSVDIGHGASYGNTLSWTERDKPKSAGVPVAVQVELDKEKFYEMFVKLLSGPTPGKVN